MLTFLWKAKKSSLPLSHVLETVREQIRGCVRGSCCVEVIGHDTYVPVLLADILKCCLGPVTRCQHWLWLIKEQSLQPYCWNQQSELRGTMEPITHSQVPKRRSSPPPPPPLPRESGHRRGLHYPRVGFPTTPKHRETASTSTTNTIYSVSA